MTSDLAPRAQSTIETGGFRFELAAHNCFGCGTLNANGLGLTLHIEPERCWTELQLDRRFEGWDGIAHGGITSTILDEVMAWSLVGSDNWGVTARLAVEFRRPVPIETRVRAEGWVTQARRRVVDTAAHLVDAASGIELATATGVYVAAGQTRKRELQEQYGFRRLGAVGAGSSLMPAIASETTARAVALVAERRAPAEELGRSLAELSNDPDAFAAALRRGLVELSDPEYLEGQRRVAPGIGDVHGVRWPLLAAVERGFRQATKGDRATQLLFIADRLFRETELESRWFAFGLLERTLTTETERTWQLLRRAAREASDWITVDSLAHPYGKGIAQEPFRWAELEQLVYSPSRWERRLVGSTIATMTHGGRRTGRDPGLPRQALALLAQLMGDADPDVQKALSWAYRSLAQLDPTATASALAAETDQAAETADGHRAWVIRDTLAKLDPATADRLRERLAGIRKRPGAAPTSRAAESASRFGALPDPSMHPEPPLI